MVSVPINRLKIYSRQYILSHKSHGNQPVVDIMGQGGKDTRFRGLGKWSKFQKQF